jgi:hypothetical protein
MYRFVSRWSGAVAGAVAMLFPMITQASRYAVEARPSGLILGASRIALIAWQAAIEKKRRFGALILFALNLSVALAHHCYVVISQRSRFTPAPDSFPAPPGNIGRVIFRGIRRSQTAKSFTKRIYLYLHC